jgi:hypothetical protein
MDLTKMIELIIKEQHRRFPSIIPVDVKISNGNIILRSFHIHRHDEFNKVIEGITFQEEYIHTREERAPIYCTLKLSDIKELYCEELDFHFLRDSYPAFS